MKTDRIKLNSLVIITLLCLACVAAVLSQIPVPVKADTTKDVTVTFLIDYGNGTYEVSRATVPDKSVDSANTELVGAYASSYDALVAAASVKAQDHGGGLGRFITVINGVKMSGLWWWSFWLYQPNGTWYFSDYYASSIKAHDYGSVFCWRYTNGSMSGHLYPHDYPATNITVSRSSSSDSAEISGTLTGITQTFIGGGWSSPSIVGLSGKVVTLYSAPAGSSSWEQVGQATTASDGSYSFTPDASAVTDSSQVKAVFAGDSQNVGSSAVAAGAGMFPIPFEYLAVGIAAAAVCSAGFAVFRFRVVKKRKSQQTVM